LQIIHFIIEDGTGDGVRDWEDARKWADGNDGAFAPLDPGIIVLADHDRSLWTRILQDCSTIGCSACNYTPQWQIIDEGGVTVSDRCAVPPGGNECLECGYQHDIVHRVLEGILPDVWCGESMP
jgi:hypothetical protein